KIAAGANKPEIIFMSGDLMAEDSTNIPTDARRLQKPFRVSDVLHHLVEVFTIVSVPSRKR
ncbi:hypothetical protein ACXHJ6_32235, partial [Streptomyces sp. A3]